MLNLSYRYKTQSLEVYYCCYEQIKTWRTLVGCHEQHWSKPMQLLLSCVSTEQLEVRIHACLLMLLHLCTPEMQKHPTGFTFAASLLHSSFSSFSFLPSSQNKTNLLHYTEYICMHGLFVFMIDLVLLCLIQLKWKLVEADQQTVTALSLRLLRCWVILLICTFRVCGRLQNNISVVRLHEL